MSQAPNYTPITSFAEDENNQASGRSTIRTQELDDELANIQASINALNSNLKKIQRDDDKLQDLIVEPYALSEQVRALLASKGTVRGIWAQNTDYYIGEVVQNSVVAYVCSVNHNSGTIFNSGLWIAISGDGSSLVNAQNAALSASNANNSAATASAAAANASASATNALNSATSANSASVNSANSATQAQNSATSATTSATSALSSATNALNSANQAQSFAVATIPHQTVSTTGTASAYTATTPLPMNEYVDGKPLTLKIHVDCAANATIQFNGNFPIADLKVKRSDGSIVPVATGDLIGGDIVNGMWIQNGTSLLVEPSVIRPTIENITVNTTLTNASALDKTFIISASGVTVTLPPLSNFPELGGFDMDVQFGASLMTQGSDQLRLYQQNYSSFAFQATDYLQVIRRSGFWVVIPLSFTPARTWQNLTASRALGTTYTNTTGYEIEVSVSLTHVSVITTLTVGGVVISSNGGNAVGEGLCVSGTVPNGATYIVNAGNTLTTWAECR
jgi:hypothetical protein